MISRPSESKTSSTLAAAMLAVALFATAGCATQKDIDALPSLGQVTPIGPKGKKCYDYCAQAKASCDRMCPHSLGICQDDCVTESKNCLVECPELKRPPKPVN